MDSSSLVSVIIPAFNDARFVRQAVESVLAQTHRSIEVLVVDDGSIDDTAAIASSFGAPVRVFQQRNSGAAAARNRGLDEAKGEYLAFLDADDFWHPKKIERQLHHLESCSQCIAVYCRKVEVQERDSRVPWETARPAEVLDGFSEKSDDSGWLYLQLLRNSIVHTSTIILSRETATRVGRFDESLRKGQDLDYWLRLSRLGPIHMLDGVLSAYRIHNASISHRALTTNYHAQVVERAVSLFGPSDPVGQSLDPGELSRILALSWFEFAYQHYRTGSHRLCLESILRSLDYRPHRWNAWWLAARAAVRTLVPGLPAPSRNL